MHVFNVFNSFGQLAPDNRTYAIDLLLSLYFLIPNLQFDILNILTHLLLRLSHLRYLIAKIGVYPMLFWIHVRLLAHD